VEVVVVEGAELHPITTYTLNASGRNLRSTDILLISGRI
jgi:hypothetical protein